MDFQCYIGVGEEESIYDYIASFQEKLFIYYNVGNNFVSV